MTTRPTRLRPVLDDSLPTRRPDPSDPSLKKGTRVQTGHGLGPACDPSRPNQTGEQLVLPLAGDDLDEAGDRLSIETLAALARGETPARRRRA